MSSTPRSRSKAVPLTPAQRQMGTQRIHAEGRYEVSWYGQWYAQRIHDPTSSTACRWARNSLRFATIEDAERAGHHKCPRCFP